MGLLGTIRPAIGQLAHYSGVLSHRERQMASGLTVLMYHRVLPDERCADYPFPSLVIGASAFREQVRWLARHCRVTTVSSAIGTERSPSTVDDRPQVCVTFDDGYLDNVDVAAPILDAAGIRATFYVTSGLIGTARLLWFDQVALQWQSTGQTELARIAADAGATTPVDAAATESARAWAHYLKQCEPSVRNRILESAAPPTGVDITAYRLMSVDQVRDLHRRGHEIGSHTVSHPLLPQLGDSELTEELAESRQSIGSWLGQDIHGICYPNGDHDDRVIAAARAAGYTYGCTTRRGLNGDGRDAMRLRRVDVNPRRVTDGAGRHDPLGFRAELCQLYGRW